MLEEILTKLIVGLLLLATAEVLAFLKNWSFCIQKSIRL